MTHEFFNANFLFIYGKILNKVKGKSDFSYIIKRKEEEIWEKEKKTKNSG